VVPVSALETASFMPVAAWWAAGCGRGFAHRSRCGGAATQVRGAKDGGANSRLRNALPRPGVEVPFALSRLVQRGQHDP